MIDLDIVKVKRVIGAKEAREKRGDVVLDIVPDITTAGIYVDEETNEPFLVYMPMPEDMVPELRQAVRSVKYS